MEEKDSWKIFEATGSVTDYLNYRQENKEQQRNETYGQYESGRNDATGYDSSQRTTGRL